MPSKSLLISGFAAAAVAGGLAFWMLRGVETAPPSPSPSPRTAIQDKNAHTVANEWQWQNFADGDEPGKSAATSEVPANVVAIYRILQSIKVDESGRVVADQTMKEALEEGFDDLGPNLTASAMADLQQSIRTGLPGQAGEETAQILDNYYRFRLAELEFEGQPLQQSPADHYEQLVQLRRSYLGAETADDLFAVEDANGRHMLAAIAIQTNANLSEADKQAQQRALQEKLNDRLLALGLLQPEEVAADKVQWLREQGASNADIYSARRALMSAEGASDLAAADREEAAWQRRFNGFWQARRYVVQAGLDDVERERQIEHLLDQYFSAEERERARLTSFDWQSREPN